MYQAFPDEQKHSRRPKISLKRHKKEKSLYAPAPGPQGPVRGVLQPAADILIVLGLTTAHGAACAPQTRRSALPGCSWNSCKHPPPHPVPQSLRLGASFPPPSLPWVLRPARFVAGPTQLPVTLLNELKAAGPIWLSCSSNSINICNTFIES